MAECQTCGAAAEFGYKDKKGSMEWFCAAHRLNEHYADARLPKPEQKTESKQVAAPLQFHPLAEIFPLIEGKSSMNWWPTSGRMESASQSGFMTVGLSTGAIVIALPALPALSAPCANIPAQTRFHLSSR
jgi:hypothetical protein